MRDPPVKAAFIKAQRRLKTAIENLMRLVTGVHSVSTAPDLICFCKTFLVQEIVDKTVPGIDIARACSLKLNEGLLGFPVAREELGHGGVRVRGVYPHHLLHHFWIAMRKIPREVNKAWHKFRITLRSLIQIAKGSVVVTNPQKQIPALPTWQSVERRPLHGFIKSGQGAGGVTQLVPDQAQVRPK